MTSKFRPFINSMDRYYPTDVTKLSTVSSTTIQNVTLTFSTIHVAIVRVHMINDHELACQLTISRGKGWNKIKYL